MQGQSVRCAVEGWAFLAGILPLPMLVDGVCHLDQPGAVLKELQNIRRAEKLAAVLRRVAQRLEQAGGNERRNVMRLAIKHPPRLLRREPGGQLARKSQKPILFFFHAAPVAPTPKNRTRLLQIIFVARTPAFGFPIHRWLTSSNS
jgi:hypothetical protein